MIAAAQTYQAYQVAIFTLGGIVVGFVAGVGVGVADRARRARWWLDEREPARR